MSDEYTARFFEDGHATFTKRLHQIHGKPRPAVATALLDGRYTIWEHDPGLGEPPGYVVAGIVAERPTGMPVIRGRSWAAD